MTSAISYTDAILSAVRCGSALPYLGNLYARALKAERKGQDRPHWVQIHAAITNAHKREGLSLVQFRASLIERHLLIPARGVPQ